MCASSINLLHVWHTFHCCLSEMAIRSFAPSLACLQYPKAFAASLLDYVGSQAQYLHTLLAMSQSNKVESQAHAERLRFAEMALEALRNVIKNNPGGLMYSSSCSAIF